MNLQNVLNYHLLPLMAGNARFETRKAGGAKATGKIVFTANPTAGHAITVGDKTLTFKASADANKDEVTIGADLTTTISNIITKLESYASGKVTMMAYTKTDTNTALTATAKQFSTAANGFALASSSTNGTVTAVTGGADGLLSLKDQMTIFSDSTAADHQYFTLPAPPTDQVQVKTLLLAARSQAKNIVVETGNNTATFDAAGEFVSFIGYNGRWYSMGGTVTIA